MRRVIVALLLSAVCLITIFCSRKKEVIMVDNIGIYEEADNGSSFIVNGDVVSRKLFEELMRELVVDERSHFCYETSTGGVSGYRARHRTTGADVTYKADMDNGTTIFKLIITPGTAIHYKDKRAGFEFWYPPNWRIVKLKMDDCIVEVQPSDAFDPYARLESFSVSLAKKNNNPFSTSPRIWQAGLGQGENTRSSLTVAIENTKYVLILNAREINQPVLEDILYSFRILSDQEKKEKTFKKTDCHKEDINHFKRYNKALASGDVFDVWLDMLKAWGGANHLIPLIDEKPLFEESILNISGHHGLQHHSESRRLLESAVMASSYSYNSDSLPLLMFQSNKPLTQITPEDLAKMYSALGRWTFTNVGFSPD